MLTYTWPVVGCLAVFNTGLSVGLRWFMTVNASEVISSKSKNTSLFLRLLQHVDTGVPGNQKATLILFLRLFLRSDFLH